MNFYLDLKTFQEGCHTICLKNYKDKIKDNYMSHYESKFTRGVYGMIEITGQVKENYKEHAKFYQQYDMPSQWKTQPIASKEPNLDPFKKINWKNLYDANENTDCSIKKKMVKLFGVTYVWSVKLIVVLKMW